jgi:hypothetical protein
MLIELLGEDGAAEFAAATSRTGRDELTEDISGDGSDEGARQPATPPRNRRQRALHAAAQMGLGAEALPAARSPAAAVAGAGAPADTATGGAAVDDGAADQARRDVIAAAAVVHGLADRIGAVEEGGDVPRAVRRQRWSALNVPLMWAAASADLDVPVLRWLCELAGRIPNGVAVAGEIMPGDQAARAG